MHSESRYVLFFFFFKGFYFCLRERGREGERERQKHLCAKETLISCLSSAPHWGPGLQRRHVPWPGNWTCDPKVTGWLTCNPMSLTSQGSTFLLYLRCFIFFSLVLYNNFLHLSYWEYRDIYIILWQLFIVKEPIKFFKDSSGNPLSVLCLWDTEYIEKRDMSIGTEGSFQWKLWSSH